MARTPQLLGPDGRPIERRTLTQAVAAPAVTGVRRPFAGTIATGLTPERLATILKRATEGSVADYLTLAEEMEERDPHYAAVLGTRKRAVAGIEPIVTPGDDSPRAGEIADFVRQTIVDQPWFNTMVVDLLDALGKGYAACEILWRTGPQWTPAACPWRDPRYFVWDETRTVLRLAADGEPNGVELPPGKFIVHVPHIKSGLPIRGGLARLVAWSTLFKSYAMKDWAAFCEVYGLPLRLGKYGPEASPQDIATLIQAVAGIGTDAAAVLPRAMEIQFEGIGEGRGAAELFQRLAEYLDGQVSKAVLGQTMTTDDGASLSQAQVHNGVRIDVAQADGGGLATTLNRDLVRVAVDLNYGPQEAYPWLSWPITEPEDTQAVTEQLTGLVPLGLRVRADDVRERLGWAAPEDGDEVLGGPASAGDDIRPGDDTPSGAAPQRAGRSAQAARPRDAVDDLVDQLDTAAGPATDALIDQVRAVIDQAESIPDAMARLEMLYSELRLDDLADVIGEAMALADLSGRAEVGDV
ncbi:DUF935 domain-containing protein [Roseospira marina]|uniref:DUF935 domain-containing protein n=1 Tax=Roseospira marina TaxID=140057 RepID=A0A5M6I7F3_9PROT|nr:DUF935 domain-containing protein [Roseospira marina]KAA5603765.1 DUF935 domain-containing protein [Roseospira marina]MBB4316044.1 phage gp29-like protein [Roseospira marina]MBB5089238.1 phage gp29-like protein [Roseospira marina]